MRKPLLSYLVIFLLMACSKSYRPTSKEHKWIGKQFEFPANAMFIVQGDTVQYDPKVNDYNIVVNFNSSEYSESNLQMLEWKRFLNSINQDETRTGLCFIFSNANINSINEITKHRDFRHPLLFVSNNYFKYNNDCSSMVILIDDCNRILSIGNPLKNDTVAQFYRNILTDSNFESEKERESWRLKFSSKRILTGVIHPGKTKQNQIYITNTGDSIAEILRIDSSCDCTLSKVHDKTIHPGQTIRLDIIQKYDSTVGFFSRNLYLYLINNPNPINIELTGFMSNK